MSGVRGEGPPLPRAWRFVLWVGAGILMSAVRVRFNVAGPVYVYSLCAKSLRIHHSTFALARGSGSTGRPHAFTHHTVTTPLSRHAPSTPTAANALCPRASRPRSPRHLERPLPTRRPLRHRRAALQLLYTLPKPRDLRAPTSRRGPRSSAHCVCGLGHLHLLDLSP